MGGPDPDSPPSVVVGKATIASREATRVVAVRAAPVDGMLPRHAQVVRTMAAVHAPRSTSIGPSCASALLIAATMEAVAEPTPRPRVVTTIPLPPKVAVAIAIRPPRAVVAVVAAIAPAEAVAIVPAAATAAEDVKLTY